MTFKASLATVISEVVKEGQFATVNKPMSDELHRFIAMLMAKANKPSAALNPRRAVPGTR